MDSMINLTATGGDAQSQSQSQVAGATPSVSSTPPPTPLVSAGAFPFQLNIAVEYQSWLLTIVCLLVFSLWFLPCLCGSSSSRAARRFTAAAYTRLHQYYACMLLIDVVIVGLTVGVLPDWTFNELIIVLARLLVWVLVHVQKFAASLIILVALFLAFRLRDQLLVASGLDHVEMVRWGALNPLRGGSMRAVEVVFWKVDDLPSSVGVKANDVFVEVHMGDNEVARTRVRNNAGSGCILKESIQLNLSAGGAAADGPKCNILLRNQSLVASSTLARVQLAARELTSIEERTGGAQQDHFAYTDDFFVQLALAPRGKIWIRVQSVRGENDLDDVVAPGGGRDDVTLLC